MDGAEGLDRPPGLSYAGAVARGAPVRGAAVRGRGRGRGHVQPNPIPVAQLAILQERSSSRPQRSNTRRVERGNPYDRLPPLHQACEKGHSIDALLGSGADVNQKDHAGRNALTLAYRSARRTKNLSTMEKLMNHLEAELWVLNDKRPKGDSVPLALQVFHDRAAFGEAALIQLISNPCFPIRQQDASGLNIVDHLCSVNSPALLNAALNHPAVEINPSAVFTAIRKDQFGALEALIAKNVPLDIYEQVTGHQPLHVACELGRWGWINAMVAAGADINSQNLYGNTPAMAAMEKGMLLTAGKLLALENIDVSIHNHEGKDLLHFFILHICRTNMISGHCAESLVKLLNLNRVPLIIDSDFDVIDRLEPFNDWVPCDWMSKVLTRLAPEALKKIAAPLTIKTDEDLKMAFLISPQVITTALLIDEPEYRGRLLNNLKCLFPLSAGEVLQQEDDPMQWNEGSGQLVPWVSYALWYIRPQEPTFVEWLYGLGLDTDNIAQIVQNLPSKNDILQDITASATKIVDNCTKEALDQEVHVNQSLSLNKELTSHVHRDAVASLRSRASVLMLADKLQCAVNVADTLERLRDANKVISLLPVFGVKAEESCDESRDAAELVMLLVPGDKSIKAIKWLIKHLGINSERGLSVLYDIGLATEEDFEKRGICFKDFEANPSEVERQRLLSLIAEQCQNK